MNRLDSNGRTMTRRNGVGVKVILTVAAGLFVVYCLYSYHEIHTRLKKSEEKGDRLRQQHDSLSAQLQVVYEHKSRLEKTLQQEKADHRKSKNDLMSQKSELETRFYNEKQELLNRISSINQEHKMLQSQHEDLQMELSKLHESHNKLQEDNEVIQSQHNAEYQQLKQEKENELASLKDEVANLQRKNMELQKKLDLLMQSNQYNMQKQQQQFVQQQQKQPIYDGNPQLNNQNAQPQPVQQQQEQFGLHNQAGFQQGGYNQQHDQGQLEQQQQFHQQQQQQQQADVQQGGFGQQNQFNQPHDTLQQHQQQPAAQQQFNQFKQVPNVQEKQPGDNVNFQPKFGDDKLSDQRGADNQQQLPQQHLQQPQEQGGLHAEQNQQQQEEQNNQINQMQVNPPDLNKDGKKIKQTRLTDNEAKPENLENNAQQIAKPIGEKSEAQNKDSAQQGQSDGGQNLAIQAPDVHDKEEGQKPVQAQVLEPPDAEDNVNVQEKQNEAVGAAPVINKNKNSKEGGAVVNSLDENDVADLPVHRGVKDDPANAMENPQVAAKDNNGDNADEGVALADNDDDADDGGGL